VWDYAAGRLEAEESAEVEGGQCKFYEAGGEQKGKKGSEVRSSLGRDSRSLGRQSEGEDFKLREKKQRVAIYQRTRNLKKSQLVLDLSELESSKEIEEEQVHRERE
jgi:hypothetical protein